MNKKRTISAILTAAMTASVFTASVQAAPHSGGAYTVGNGILISAADIKNDGLITLTSKNVQYDSADKKKGTAVFEANSEKTVKAVTGIFGSSYTYDGVIDYVGSGRDKGTFTIPITTAAEDNYFTYVLVREAGTINLWIDNSSARIADNTTGAKQAAFAVEGTGGVAYAIDCGTLSAGNHTLTIDGASGSWCPDICAVAVYPQEADDFKLPYQNESLSFEERTADLVARMTLEEKIAQLGHNAPAIPRLGVSSYYYWREGAHGVARQGKATSFPVSIAMSNTWDPALYQQAAEITSTEARIKNNRYDLNYWSPTINMSRDPRWGRNDESLGEDTLLTSEMGSAFVRGLQGDDEKYIKTIATVKHFLANNCEGERQTGTSELTESELRDYYAKAFQNIVEGTDPGAVMSAYNATTVTRNGEKLWDYIGMPANEDILTGYLRRSWGFSGFVTGDCGAVADLNGNAFKRALFDRRGDSRPLSSIDQSETVALSVQAGNEMDCGAINTAYGLEAVEKGYMSEDEVDIALFRIFLERFKTGEFDDTSTYRTYKASELESDESVAVAEKAAEESIVLLENKDSFLPISKNKNIALVGEMASQTYLGDYSGSPDKTTSPYEGLQNTFGKDNVHFLGHVDNDTAIMNIKNLRFVDSKGSETAIDLSGATVSGAALSGSTLMNVTPSMQLKLADIDFSKVAKVKADIEVPTGSIGGAINICYGSTTLVEANIETASAANGGYVTYEADYTGADGGYNGTADLYITASAHSGFDMTAYTSALDAADVIIAYSSTIVSGAKDPDGATTDCKESTDRTSIKLPYRDRGTIEKLCEKYGNKTVVVMQSAGEMDVTAIKDKCRALIWTGYNGQKQGEALAKVLSGAVNPSGKLSTTWYAPDDLKVMTVNGTSTNDVDTNGTTQIVWKRNNYSLAPKSASDTWQGRTYMYYKGTPQYPFGYGLSYTSFEYSDLKLNSSTLDANGTITATVDIKNTGAVPGTETVEVYMANKASDGISLPLQQLAAFKRVELAAGETKTVEFTVDAKTLARWSETELKNYVPTGEYTLFVGGNVYDRAQTADLTVSGTLDSKIKTVYAVPTGLTATGAYDAEAGTTAAINTIEPRLSVVMTDESELDLSQAEITYTSTDTDVAKVDKNGVVSAGTEAGVTTITASVTVNGETKETSFPVVTKLQDAIPSATRAQYLADLDTEYGKYNESNYRADFWAQLMEVYNTAKTAIENAVDAAELDTILGNAKADMAAIRDHLKDGEKAYTVTVEPDWYRNAAVTVVYNGDEDTPQATLVTEINGEKTEHACSATMTEDYSVSLTGLAYGDTVKAYVINGNDTLSDTEEENIAKPPTHVEYDLSDERYLRLTALASGEEFERINGVGGYGDFNNITGVNYNVSYNGKSYTLTGGLQGGKGSFTKSNVYFIPFDCYKKATVSVFFDSSNADRKLRIAQNDGTKNGIELGIMGGAGNRNIQTLTVTTEDMSKPVYIQPQMKESIYMIIVDYEGEEEIPTAKPTTQPTPAPTAKPTEEPAGAFPQVEIGYAAGKVTMSADTDDLQSAVVIRAAYDGDRFTGASIYDASFIGGKAELDNIELEVGDKLYVWDSLENGNPYSEVYTYDGTEPEVTEEPEPTAVPEDKKIEFESYIKSWVTDAVIKEVSGASGGKDVDSTRNGDIFYFGEQSLDDLKAIEQITAVRNRDGDGNDNITAVWYAVDVSGMDVSDASKTDIQALLTNDSVICTVGPFATVTGNWTTFLSNSAKVTTTKTGTYGLFVKLNTGNKYCGNQDYITLKYTD